MSDFGMFESDEAAQAKPQVQARLAARKMDAAIDVVRSKFGRFLLGATGIDEFGDRWHYSKHDIRAAVEPYVFPNTGTMRRLQNAMKADWKVAHPYKLALDHDDAGYGQMETDNTRSNQDLDETYHPSSGNLIPEGNFEGYKDSVDQDGPEKVSEHVFTPGGDSGSDRHARRRQAAEWKKVNNDGYPAGADGGNMTKAERDKYNAEEDEKHGLNHEAARLVADIYTDFARSNGLRVASLDTLDAYASTGLAEADFRLLAGLIVRQAEAECDDDEDADSEAPSESESDDSDSDDDEGDDYDFGGESASEGEESDSDDDDDEESDEDGDGDHDDDDHHTEDDDEDYDFGGGEEQGGGEQYTVPEQAPELSPEMMGEIPQGDTDGSAPVPPEVIDSLLGLPEGTIEQLLLEEVEQGAQGGDPGMSGPPMPEQGAPQGGGDDFFGEGGGDNTEPPRVARRRQAKDYGRKCSECKSNNTDYSSSTNDYDCYDCGATFKPYSNPKKSPEKESRRQARQFWAAPDEDEDELTERQKREQKDSLDTKHESWMRSKSARSFWAAEGDPEQESEGGGGEEQVAPAQDPAAAMGGGDPAAMGMQQPMLPPPGSGAVAPPAPPAPLENQPAEDALLDTANQAIMQMIDQETAEYQQIIDPLSQALQAIQFAQQVEQSEHPMDVTPPQGTVDVSPSAAPGGQPPMQQQAMRRWAGEEKSRFHDSQFGLDYGDGSDDDDWSAAESRRQDRALMQQEYLDSRQRRQRRQSKVEFGIRNAAALIASRYRLSPTGHQMLLNAALGRRGYEHVVEALKLVPLEVRKAAAIHMSHLFAAGNQRFNTDVFMKTVMAGTSKDRYENSSYTGPRDKRREEHGRQDQLDWFAGPDDGTNTPYRGKGADNGGPDPVGVNASRGRLPFDRPRLAGETLVPTAVLDAFEHYSPGIPRVDDGNATNDLPPMPGANPNGKNAASQKAVDRFQRWQKSQQQKGLATTQGEAGVHNFLQTRNPVKKRVGPDAQNLIHQHLGLEPDAVKAPKAKPVKAVNPVLKGKGSKTPAAPTAKSPAPKAAPKTASFFTRKVSGWRWDDHLNGYLSKEARAFTCACGEKIASPSYKTCACGKVWNVYAIGDSHHLASDTADVYIAREIEVRPGVIMANRKMAAPDRWFEHEQEDLHRQRRQEEEDADAWAEKRMNTPHPDDEAYREANRKMAGRYEFADEDDADLVETLYHRERKRNPKFREQFPSLEDYQNHEPLRDDGYDPHGGEPRHVSKLAKDGGCTCWEGYERVPGTEPCASKSCRKKTGAQKIAGCESCHGMARQMALEDLTDSMIGNGMSRRDAINKLNDPYDDTLDKETAYYLESYQDALGHEGHTASRRAQATFKQHLAEIERLADWTKYDSPDPTRDTKVKPPSTKIKSQPGDWTNRDFTGPTKGQWREPEPTELPRKTRKKK
jgi:hypothetical protein